MTQTTEKTKLTIFVRQDTFKALCHQSERLNLSLAALADYLLASGMERGLLPAPGTKKRTGRHNRMNSSGRTHESRQEQARNAP